MQYFSCVLLVCVVCVQYVRTAVLFPSLREMWNSFFKTDKPCGVEASPNPLHRNPWLAFIEIHLGDEPTPIRGAGALIGERHVVTAAHCAKIVEHTGLKVRFGEYDVTTSQDCVSGVCADAVVTINVANIHISPRFDGTGGDIAILVLEKAVPYTDFIRPICLPHPTAQIEGKVEFFAAGWGEVNQTYSYSNVKKLIPLPSWKDKDCRSTYAYSHAALPDGVICAGGVEGVDTCHGDSGGPLVLYRDQAELWGVTSTGAKYCGLKGYPGIYTNVRLHLDWIYEVVKSNEFVK